MKRFLFLLVALIVAGAAMFSEAHAARAVSFFENLKHTKGRFSGKPFILLDWEKQIIRDVYGTIKADGTRQYKYIYIEMPKKQGKSELAAGAALYQLFADGEKNGEIYGCAADREQATLIFDVAVDMIEQAPALDKRARITKSQKIIEDRVSGSIYKVMSAEAYTKHGLNLSACIFDELHAQPNRESMGCDDFRSWRCAQPADLVDSDHGGRRSGPGQRGLGAARIRFEDPGGRHYRSDLVLRDLRLRRR